MKPSENSQSADFDWTGRPDLHAPSIRIVDGCDVSRPAATVPPAAITLPRRSSARLPHRPPPLAFDLLGRLGNLAYRKVAVLGI